MDLLGLVGPVKALRNHYMPPAINLHAAGLELCVGQDEGSVLLLLFFLRDVSRNSKIYSCELWTTKRMCSDDCYWLALTKISLMYLFFSLALGLLETVLPAVSAFLGLARTFLAYVTAATSGLLPSLWERDMCIL